MSNFIQGWIIPMVLLGTIITGVNYGWKYANRDRAERGYQNCILSYAKYASGAAEMRQRTAQCKFEHGLADAFAGRYGPSTGETISLAMTKRPQI